MKRLIFTLFVMCLAIMAHAQATSLTVDCQNPGWLSNKINYGDQLTVRNLKVTGYINSVDLDFINTLVEVHSLRHLDLEDVTLVDDDSKHYGYYGYMLTDKIKARLGYLALPKNIENVRGVGNDDGVYFNADSLICNFNKAGLLPRFGNNSSSDVRTNSSNYNHYIELGNKTDSMANSRDNHYRTGQTYNVKSHNMRFIGARRDLAINGQYIDSAIINITDFSKIEVLGYNALFTTALPDTINLPNIEIFCENAFRYHNGMHVYLGKNLNRINYYPQWYGYDRTVRDFSGEFNSTNVPLNGAKIHLRSTTPPTIVNSLKGLKGDTIFIPYGTLNAYLNNSSWKSAVNNGYIKLQEESRPLVSIKT